MRNGLLRSLVVVALLVGGPRVASGTPPQLQKTVSASELQSTLADFFHRPNLPPLPILMSVETSIFRLGITDPSLVCLVSGRGKLSSQSGAGALLGAAHKEAYVLAIGPAAEAGGKPAVGAPLLFGPERSPAVDSYAKYNHIVAFVTLPPSFITANRLRPTFNQAVLLRVPLDPGGRYRAMDTVNCWAD